MAKNKKSFFSRENIMGDYRRYDFVLSDLWVGLGVFVLTLIFYGYYLTPSVASGDNGELTSAMFYLGLGHAPGYPIHSLFGKLMTFLPFGSVAWKANFFSAFSGAMTVFLSFMVYYKLMMSLGNKRIFAYYAAVVGGFVFMTSGALWSQSITTEVYAFSAVFHPLLLLIILKWKDETISMSTAKHLYLGERYLMAYGFVLGIGIGGHQTIVLVEFFVLFMVIYVLYHYQIKHRKSLVEHFSTGLPPFIFVLLCVLVSWILYFKYIVAYSSNLFVNNNMFTKSGVWGFVIPNLLMLSFYLFIKFFLPNIIRRNDIFQRLAFFIVKFMGMFFLGFCVYLYLFIRSHGDPPINWGGISESITVWEKIAKFFTMINRKQFAPSYMDQNLFTIYQQFKLAIVDLHLEQFARPMYVMMGLGMVELYRRSKFYLAFLLFGFATYVFQLTFYLNADFRERDLFFVEVFYIFSYFILSCFVPFGFLWILKKLEYLVFWIKNYNQKLGMKNNLELDTAQSNPNFNANSNSESKG